MTGGVGYSKFAGPNSAAMVRMGDKHATLRLHSFDFEPCELPLLGCVGYTAWVGSPPSSVA